MLQQAIMLTVFVAASLASWKVAQQFCGAGRAREDGGFLTAFCGPDSAQCLAPLGLRIVAILMPDYEKRLNALINSAGDAAQVRAREVAGRQLTAGIAAACIWTAIALLRGPGASAWAAGLVLVFVAGWCVPLARLHNRAHRRRRAILRELPFALDLMAASMQAGYDFNAAVGLYIEKGSHGPLRDELALMAGAARLGKTRRESLHETAERVGLNEMRSVISAIVQGSEMGTGIAEILEVQADALRQKWSFHAEKRAARAPAKMIFPLALFVVPATMIVIIVPIAIRMMGVYRR